MSAWQMEIITAVQQEFVDLPSLAECTRLVVRLTMAVLLGGVLGYEREAAGAPAGFRTHMLVSLGSALFVVAPLQAGMYTDAMSRVLQGLIAGIGFLGAGAIIKLNNESQVRGLTTAASIWFTASLGITVGLGREALAVLGTLFALFILGILRWFKKRRRRKMRALDRLREERKDSPL